MASVLVCQMLAGDARKAEAFGKTNVSELRGFVKESKFQKSELTMAVGRWVKESLGKKNY